MDKSRLLLEYFYSDDSLPAFRVLDQTGKELLTVEHIFNQLHMNGEACTSAEVVQELSDLVNPFPVVILNG